MIKKILLFFVGFLGVLIAAAIVLPIIFKEDIQKRVEDEIGKNLNATVVWDTDHFHLSFIKHFPSVTLGLEQFGIVNKEPFEGELLFAVERLDIAVNLKQILIDEELRVTGIYLEHPIVNLIGDEEGNVNWDVYIGGSEDEIVEEEVTEEEEPLEFGIDKWEIENAEFTFTDPTIPFSMELIGLDHEGSGDFTLSVFDMVTHTRVDSVRMVFDGVSYLNNQEFELDATLNMDLDQFKFTFKENEARINQFKMAFDGWFAMPENGYEMDISYASRDNSFKSLLSLVPSAYTEGYDDLESSGSLSFGGRVNGLYSETSMPAFDVALSVVDGMFHYPDLPTSVTNVQMDMAVNNSDGVIDNTSIHINRLHVDFGNNPFDATLSIANLKNYPVKATMLGKLNLEEITSMFPMEGTTLRGTMEMDLKVDGIYDSVKHQIPTIDGHFLLKDGYVASSDVPVPMENIQVESRIENKSGILKDTKISVDPFHMDLQDEQLSASLFIENMDDYTWDAKVNGTVDMARLLPVINTFYAMPTTSMEGKIIANLQTKGKMSDLEAERYANLPTSGTVQVNNFVYVDSELLPQGFRIDQSVLSFNPRQVTLEQFDGSVGRTDLQLTGALRNHIGYVFGDGIVQGDLQFNSKVVDLNEWMADEEVTDASAEGEDVPLEVYPVPENIDFTLNSKIDLIVYDNLALNNAKGTVRIKDGIVDMRDLAFDMLGGRVVMNGQYHTKDIKRPYFNYDLNVSAVSISQSFSAFNTVQRMAPIARNISGDYTTSFKIDGFLDEEMMPDFGSINGAGLIKIAQATLSGSKLMTGVNALTNQANADRVNLKDLVMSAKIQNGRFSVDPFDVVLGKYQSTVSGSNGLDGSLDYNIKMDIPTGDLGTQLNQSIANLTGRNVPAATNVKLSIGVGGTYDDPKLQLLTADTGQQLKTAAKEEVKEVLVETIQEKTGQDLGNVPTSTEEAKEQVKQEVDTTKAEVKSIAKTQADSLKQGLIKGDTAAVEKAVKDAQDKIKNLFNRKKKKNNN